MRVFYLPRYWSPLPSAGEYSTGGAQTIPPLTFEVLRELVVRLPTHRSLSELLEGMGHAAQLLLPNLQLAFLLRQPDATLELVYGAPTHQERALREHLDQLIDQGQLAQALKEGLAWVSLAPNQRGLLSRIATQRHIHGLILWIAPALDPSWSQILGTLADLTAVGIEWLTGDAEASLSPPMSFLPPTQAFDLAVPTDRLTGLAHRSHFMRFIQQAILEARPGYLAVLLLDIDGFQRVNHELGYEVGDRLLCELALRLEAALRSHAAHTYLGGEGHEICFARTGADEFGIALRGVYSPQRLGELAAYLHRHIAEGFFHAGERFYLSVSIGIAIGNGPAGATHPSTLMRQADTALKRAKQLGRNRYAIYEPGWEERGGAHLRTESLLQEALYRDCFRLFFQPQFDLQSGRLVGAEVLLRLTLGDGGSIPPSCFIPIAETTGQIIEISQWTLRQVCRQIRTWEGMGLGPIPLAVNLSAVELVQPHLTEQICSILDEEGIAPHHLHLELTETAIARHESQALAILKSLHAAGFAIWIDDFGTGYSSLKSIKHYPAAGVKLDREFVQDIAHDSGSRAITRAILDLARELGYPVVAEGIEAVEQWALLRDWGCPIGQGYLLGRPVNAIEFQQRYLAPCS